MHQNKYKEAGVDGFLFRYLCSNHDDGYLDATRDIHTAIKYRDRIDMKAAENIVEDLFIVKNNAISDYDKGYFNAIRHSKLVINYVKSGGYINHMIMKKHKNDIENIKSKVQELYLCNRKEIDENNVSDYDKGYIDAIRDVQTAVSNIEIERILFPDE